MKKLIVAATVALSLNAAQAKHYHHRHHHHEHTLHHAVPRVRSETGQRNLFGLFGGMATRETSNSRPAVCYGIPWCGCWLRVQLGIKDTHYNLASWWHHYGERVYGPVVGAIARLNHHVGLVVGVTPKGDPVIKSGNHNHRVGTAVYPKGRIIEYRKD